MSQFICISSDKGGVGKSTIVINCAMSSAIQMPTKKIAVIDNDNNLSATNWLAMREVNLPDNLEFHYANTIENIKRLFKKLSCFDYVFVDTAGGDGQIQRFILANVDLALLVIQPSGLDFNTSPEHNARVKALQKIRPQLKAFNLINCCDTHPCDTDATEMINIIKSDPDLFLPVLETKIYRRKAIKKATDQGLSAEEGKDNKAIAEFHLLLQEIGVLK